MHNAMGFCICNIENAPVKACFQFLYRGFEISVTTINGITRTNIAVFRNGGKGKLVYYATSVEDAINFVNKGTSCV